MLAAGLIRDDLQAHTAPARVGEQRPYSTPTSLPVRTTSKSESENDVRLRLLIGVAEVAAEPPGAVPARASPIALPLCDTAASTRCPETGAEETLADDAVLSDDCDNFATSEVIMTKIA